DGDVVAHGADGVALAVDPVGRPCNGTARNKLAQEHHTAPPPFRPTAADVKAEIYFLESGVANDGYAEEARVDEIKADHADEGFAVEEIDLGARRRVRGNDFRINVIVDHDEV